METLFLRVVWLSATVSAVLLPLLLVSRWLQSRVRAKSLYLLWLLLTVRLLVPVELSLPKPAVTVSAPQYEVVLPANQAPATLSEHQLTPVEPSVDTPSVQEETAAVPEQTSVPVSVLLGAMWLTGVFAIALIQISSYLVTRRALLRWAQPVSPETREQVETLAQKIGLKRSFQVRRSDRVHTAMVLGVLRPVLLLPEEQCDQLVAAHELCHLRRRDLEYKALLMAACWLHWFNPLVWWMSRVAGKNLELCCDEDVAGKQDAAFRRRYGQLLLESAAEGAGPVLSSRFGSGKAELKARLRNLFVTKKRGRALVCLALACALLVGGLVACQGTEPATPEEQLDALEESISYENSVLSFTLPEGEGDWNIHIAGRAEVDWLGGMSLHYMEGTEWTPATVYFLPLSAQTVLDVTELTLIAWLDGEERSVDLVPYLHENMWYVDQERGFTLHVPQDWAGQVLVREENMGVDFYMKNAGSWDGAGWLVGIYQTDPATWQGIEEAGYPSDQRYLGQNNQGVVYAMGPSDVRYDEQRDGEMERYNALYERVDEMLDSFQVESIEE